VVRGTRYCTGADLARVETNAILNAIADTPPGITIIDDPKRLRSAG
jgi:cholest-4-en-3-one 26-monooxygenase